MNEALRKLLDWRLHVGAPGTFRIESDEFGVCITLTYQMDDVLKTKHTMRRLVTTLDIFNDPFAMDHAVRTAIEEINRSIFDIVLATKYQ